MSSLKDKFDNYTVIPDPSVWEGIDNSLKLRARRRRAAIFAAAGAAVVAASVTLLLLRTPSNNLVEENVSHSQLSQNNSFLAIHEEQPVDTVISFETSLPSPVTIADVTPIQHMAPSVYDCSFAKDIENREPENLVVDENNITPADVIAVSNETVLSEKVSSTVVEPTYQKPVSDVTNTYKPKIKSPVSDSLAIWIPNAFSPDDPYEEKARVFKVIPNDNSSIVSFEIFIYSRTGRLVYHSKDINEGWNGVSRGQAQPMGTYVYVIEINDAVRGLQHARGNITLLR